MIQTINAGVCADDESSLNNSSKDFGNNFKVCGSLAKLKEITQMQIVGATISTTKEIEKKRKMGKVSKICAV